MPLDDRRKENVLTIFSDYGHFKAGQCIEQHDKFAAPLVPAIATPITDAEYRQYIETMATIEREVERRVHAMPAAGANAPKTGSNAPPPTRGRRVITQDEWRAELGQNIPEYAALAERHFRNKELRT